METILQDLRHALRMLAKNPSFTTVAALTLALGIGSSTAIFSVASAVFLRPLPYKDPARLVFVCRDFTKTRARDIPLSNADFVDLQNGTGDMFADLGGVFTFRAFVPREDGSAEQISKAQVTTNFFRMLGAKIELGRDFTPEDGRPQPTESEAGSPLGSVAILSHGYWQRRYGANSAILGHEMLSYGQRGPRIIGVLAPGFKLFLPQNATTDPPPDVFIANSVAYNTADRGLVTLQAIGRLKPGITLQQAQGQVDSVAADLRGKFPDWYGSDRLAIRLEPMLQYLVARVRPVMLALVGAVVFLLLIACANVANLMLVRASVRERDLAVRAALGGSWWRLVRQMLAEAVLVSLLGGLAAIGPALFAIRFLLTLAPPNLPRFESITIDWHVPLFAAAAGLASVFIFGLAPALGAARPDVIQIFRGEGQTPGSASGRLLRNVVVIAEVALSFVLLIGSGLMFRSFYELQHIDPGYDPHHVLTFLLARNWQLSQQSGRIELLNQIQSRLHALPGVEDVTASVPFPLAGGSPPPMEVRTQQASTDSTKVFTADFHGVLAGYFETLRTHVLAGHIFSDDDIARGRNVAIIDQILANKAFPNESAIGKRIFLPFGEPPWVEVIGVVAHQRTTSLAELGTEQIYFPDSFGGIGISRYWAIRTAGNPTMYAAAVRTAVAEVDKQFVISKVQSMEALVGRDQASARFSFVLIAVFAAIAVMLASVGLYGVLSTVVRQRTAEIGLRMALGAAPAEIFKAVVGQGLLLSAAGVTVGLLAAWGVTRIIASMLFGVKATDTSTFVAMTVFYFVVVAVASWLPARRATKVDPMEALRYE